MKKLIFFGACLVALASAPAKAQAGGTPVVVVQTYFTGLNTMHIAVTRADGQTEETEVRDVTNMKEHILAIALQRVLAKLVQEGYTLKSSFSGLSIRGNQVPTLLFEKHQ